MKVPQLTLDRCIVTLNGDKEKAETLATFLEMGYQGKLKECNTISAICGIVNGEITDLKPFERERKPREMSQEFKDKQYLKQLEKLQKKYNQPISQNSANIQGGDR